MYNDVIICLMTSVYVYILLQVGRVCEHTSAGVIVVFLLAFILATITQCFMFSVFFSKVSNLIISCMSSIIYYYFTILCKR